MPGENIQDWSTAAANNGTADSAINWAEGQPRNTVNNSARSMMAAIAKDRNLQNSSIVTGGSANAQTFFSGLNYTAPIPTGLRVLLKIGPSLTNTAAVTLEMDGLGPVAIKDQLGADLAAGAIVADTRVEFIYSGTNWILLATLTAPTAPVGDRDTSIANTAWVGAEVPAILAARAMFRATANTQSTGTTPYTVVFSSEVIDIGGFFNGAESWTPPAGRVLLSTSLTLSTTDPSGCIVSISFWKNVAPAGLDGSFVLGATIGLGGTTHTAMDVADGTSTYRVVVTFDRGGAVTSGMFSGMLM